MIHNNTYLIIQVTDLDKIDFNQVLETSPDTLRKSADNTKTFIKWEENTPDFIESLSDAEGPYTHDEILQILQSEEWSIPLTYSM